MDKAQDNSTLPQPSKKKKKKLQTANIDAPIAASSSSPDFKAYNQQLYEEFIHTVLKFNILNTLSKKEKADNLIRWSELAGVPIVGFTKDENFFRRNLHIFPSNHEVLKSLDSYNIGVSCYTPQDVYLDYFDKLNNPKKIRKAITESIRKSALHYHKSQDLRYFPNDEEKQDAIRKNNKKAYAKLSEEEKISPEICYDFLEGYIRPLIDFDEFYLDEVIKGINFLPKRVVDFMRGRAIYLTTEIGRSMFIHTASNFLRIEYLGLIPGVFLERQGKDNHIIHSRLIHEIGHLIHQTVISVRHYDSKLGLHSVSLEPTFPQFHQLASQLDELFTGKEDCYEESKHMDTFQQTLPGRLGFITYYSLMNQAEDFAEAFRYYILHNKYFLSSSESRKIPQFKKLIKDNKLKEKYNFMKQVIGEEGVKINKDLLNTDEYKPRD